MFRYILLILVLLSACTAQQDKDRIAQLEKQTKELQEQVKAQKETASIKEQAKCGKDAGVWFNQNWSRDKDTLLLDYSNHYNKPLNKCFILVQHNWWSSPNLSYISKSVTVFDVYENLEKARISQTKELTAEAEDDKATCTINGQENKNETFQNCFNQINSAFMEK